MSKLGGNMYNFNTAGIVSRSQLTYDKYCLVKLKKYKIINNVHIFQFSVYTLSRVSRQGNKHRRSDHRKN